MENKFTLFLPRFLCTMVGFGIYTGRRGRLERDQNIVTYQVSSKQNTAIMQYT